MALKDKSEKKAKESPAQSMFRASQAGHEPVEPPPASSSPGTPASHDHASQGSGAASSQSIVVRGAPLDTPELKKMLGVLNYQTNKGSEIAREALATYKSLSHADKHTFLNRYKEKGGKDLSWVKSFSASSVQESSERETVKAGWFFRTCVRVWCSAPPAAKKKEKKNA